MDVLSAYTESREAIQAVSKKLFEMYESNDLYQMINTNSISYLEIEECKGDGSLVKILLYNYKESSPRISFNANRNAVLECGESALDEWMKISRELLHSSIVNKTKKFLNSYPENDHYIIMAALKIYDHYSKNGEIDISKIANTTANSCLAIIEKTK